VPCRGGQGPGYPLQSFLQEVYLKKEMRNIMPLNIDNLSFAQRYGHEPIEIPFQVDSINETLRTDLWNAFYIHIHIPLNNNPYSGYGDVLRRVYRLLWMNFFGKSIDDFPNHDSDLSDLVKDHIQYGIWYKVYHFFESLFNLIEGRDEYDYIDFVEYIDNKLKINNSGFRIISNKFIPIINEIEIKEIELVKQSVKTFGLFGVQEHLNSALDLISKKPKPDLKNSIKESISMVEVISRIIEPTENTLGKALNKLESKQKINPILKIAFEKLYAYTNGKNGIRHALMENENIRIEDAKFFLVSCSAFTNYLIVKANNENLFTQSK